MSRTRHLFALALLLGLPVLSSAGELEIAASTPDVEVSTRAAGRNFMQLPSLRYDMVLATSCPERFSARALSLSIADTRIALDAGNMSDGPPFEVSISVPAAQIAPVAVEDFCTEDDGEAPDSVAQTLTIPSLLSAQAALTCTSDESTEITYASASLDVLLRCAPDEAQDVRPIP